MYCPRCGKELKKLDEHGHYYCESCQTVYEYKDEYKGTKWSFTIKEL